MKRFKRPGWTLVMAVTGGLMLLATVRPLRAQESAGTSTVTLWVNRTTGQVFIRPGRDRVPLKITGTIDTNAIAQQVQQKVEQKTESQVQAALAQSEAKQKATTASLEQQVAQMKPEWEQYAKGWEKHFKFGALMYGDYSLYTHTSYGPQFLTQINPPGPGNNLYNSFDITRGYLNFIFTPDKTFTARLTPNIYRASDGSLDYRLKYAYLQWNTPFDWNAALQKGNIAFGQVPNPLVAWEEDMYGFRYVNLTPWNFLSLSSTQPGLAVSGPVMLGPGNETKYFDYDFGVYSNGSFHAPDVTNTKQFMARVSAYPFGGHGEYDGFGLDGFYDYGYTNEPASNTSHGTQSTHITRIATLIHYSAEHYGIAGEFDWGKNAFSSGNLFSASGPPAGSTEAKLASLVQNASNAHQLGYDFFGHYDIPRTPFSLFGMFQQVYSNTQANVNPFDFERFIVGVQYTYNKHLSFALDSQNILYYHHQFSFSPADIASFNQAAVKSFPAEGVTNPVPRDIHAIFANMQFSY